MLPGILLCKYNSCSLHTSRLSLMTDYRAVHVYLSSLVPSFLKFKQELSSLCFSFANLEAWGVVLYSAQACFFLVRVLLEYTVEHVWRGFYLASLAVRFNTDFAQNVSVRASSHVIS